MTLLATSQFTESLEHIVGFLIVIFALGLLWAITAMLGKLFGRMETLDPEPVPAGPAAVDQPYEQKGGGDGPTEEEVVAISAVVAAIMGRRSRIVSIRSGAKDWSREGRREHFASHKIR